MHVERRAVQDHPKQKLIEDINTFSLTLTRELQ